MVYYYKIHTPGGKQKSWLKTHSPLLLSIFKSNPEVWKQCDTGPYDYSDADPKSTIKNRFYTNVPITTKSFLAKIIAGINVTGRNFYNNGKRLIKHNLHNPYKTVKVPIVSDNTDNLNLHKHFPPTIIISGTRNPVPLGKRATEILRKNLSGKYYLKVDNGFAGQGIKIFKKPTEAFSYLSKLRRTGSTAARGVITASDYVLQESVKNLHLDNGRKFEFRVWVLFVWKNSRDYQVYFYHDSVMRLATVPYKKGSTSARGNITTSSYYYQDTGEYKSDLLSNKDYYNQIYPKVIDISKQVVNLIKPYISFPNQPGFEMMGFDYLVKQMNNTSDLKPVLIEINRNIGYYTYPKGVHAPCVVKLNMQMIRDLAEVIIVLLEKQELTDEISNWKTY